MSVTAQAPSHQDAFTFSTQFLPFYGTLDTEQADLQFYVLHKGLLFKQAQLGNLNNRKKTGREHCAYGKNDWGNKTMTNNRGNEIN